MKVSDLFAKCLENEGVTHVFGVPGEETEDLLFSLAESSIEFVPCRHEQGAAFIANVWGRLTGKAGVCLSTLGPGATNLVTGVADANVDKAPLVAITGQGGLTRLHHESHQCLDVPAMFAPITKWNTSVAAPDVVPEVVRKAFKVAEYEKPGATHIELSEDVAKQSVTGAGLPVTPERVRRPGPDYKAIAATIKLLLAAKRPLVIAGNGAIRKLASKHLTEFVTKHGVPVASTFMGKGAVSDSLDLSLMSIGTGFKDYVMEAVETADLIVTVGYDIGEYPPQKWNPKGDKKIVHVDFNYAEVYAEYTPEVEVVGDISGALWELNRRLQDTEPGFDRGWYVPLRRRILSDIESYELKEGDAFTIPGALNVIRETLDDCGLLISDVGTHKVWIARNFLTYCPNGCIMSNGLASMGIALPGAIAASLVDPGRQIVAAMGDGGFLMNSQELETAKRVGARFTAVVFNDNDYGLISWKQQMSRGEATGTGISNPDFKAYVESFGIESARPSGPSELRSVLKSAIRGGKLSVIEVPVDTAVNRGLTDKLQEFWRTRNEGH
jgi:acetolactate synthase-1/2/3 large subunit